LFSPVSYLTYPDSNFLISEPTEDGTNWSIGGPGWLLEGIADYGRNQFGVNNEAYGWRLSGYKVGQKYTDAYRVAAAFLVFIENNYNSDIVKQLFDIQYDDTYTDDVWVDLTGESLDDLWNAYKQAGDGRKRRDIDDHPKNVKHENISSA
jgi:hypothetical protein